MKYKYSQVDKDNMAWFENDMTKASLSELALHRGNLRGLSPFYINFTYPISVIAGLNRSGKSTILAMAACAFHNDKKGFKLPERKLTYYTFSDFFIQTSEEVPQDGIEILCRIRHSRWRKMDIMLLKELVTFRREEKREKVVNGTHTHIVYVGMLYFLAFRELFPPQKRAFQSIIKHLFQSGLQDGWEDEVKTVVGRILGTEYESFCMKTHGKYRLPLVSSGDTIYSGFNMGAGRKCFI